MDAAERALRDVYAESLAASERRALRIGQTEESLTGLRSAQAQAEKTREELIASATALGIDLTSEPLPS
jgi:hypothetical protein